MAKWVSVQDRLPTDNTLVLAWDSEGADVMRFRNAYTDDKRHHAAKWVYEDRIIVTGVTHWMPLPEPPTL